jgi:exodeoxyribonuclease VII large subunit
MAGRIKSQWDFGGELFAPSEVRRVLSVSEVTTTVRRLIEERLGSVWVTGEVTNFRAQSSGHLYFAIKDVNAQLSCVCFRDEARGSRHLLKDGAKVVLHGDMTVYEARGQYQLLVREVELEGMGALQAAFERLKQKLNAEGLFDAARKRPMPAFVQRIGIVTSPTGAALRDVLHVIARRHPGLEIILAPCRVQGQGAAQEIARGIGTLNECSALGRALDVILVTRGGGSLEDLWAFNEEVVARAIFASAVPVVSGVGHEIDSTISDFVADVRAATPSAAAELITEGMWRRRAWVGEALARLIELAGARVRESAEHLEWLQSRIARLHPRRQLQERWQRLDDAQTALFRATRQRLVRQGELWSGLATRLFRSRPARVLVLQREVYAEMHRRFFESARRGLLVQQQRLRVAEARLKLLSPVSVLERGFSVTRDATTGRVLRDAAETRAGQSLITQLRTGAVQSVVAAEQDAAAKPGARRKSTATPGE